MCDFRQLNNFHGHSDDSLDGAATVAQLCERTAEMGSSHITLTEHGNMSSAMKLYTEAPKHGLKPIIGIELYLAHPQADAIRQAYLNAWKTKNPLFKSRLKDPYLKINEEKVLAEIERKVHDFYFHMTIHFKTYAAYEYFCKLSPKMNARAIVRYGEVKPVALFEEIYAMKGQITVGSSCLVGMIGKTLMGSRDGILEASESQAEIYYQNLRELGGINDFFVEVFPHSTTHDWIRPKYDDNNIREEGTGVFRLNECKPQWPDGDIQKYVNTFVCRLAKKYSDKVLVSLDSHFANPEQKATQDARLSNGDEAWRFYNSYHLLTSEESYEALHLQIGVERPEFNAWVENSYDWASRFNDFKMPTNKTRWLLDVPSPNWMSELKQKIDYHNRMDWQNQEMVERLKKEINDLTNNGEINLIPYMDIVEDVARHCKENDILINLRGSGGGSLMLYLLGISAINPLKHNLSWERFITPGRIRSKSMPDADIDISDQGAVFEYLEKKYGDRFCRISTEQLLRIKSAIKDAERHIYGEVRASTEAFTKTLPVTPQGVNDFEFVFGYKDEADVHHAGLFEQNSKLQQYAQDNPAVWAAVTEMLGIQRSRGSHACGTIIAPVPIQDVMPVITLNGTRLTGFTPKSVEAAGGIKFDFLGLNTLRDIQACIRSIYQRTGIRLDPYNLPDDPKCWENFAAGKSEAVFQFDTPTVRPGLIAIKPKNLEALASVTALYRPGTLDAPSEDGRTLEQVFVSCAQGLERPNFVHPDVEHILGETNAIALYQEQTLQIFRDIGGMSYEEAESVRRAIGKKDEKTLLECSLRLKTACLNRGWSEYQADLLMKQIMASAKYSFNKSHAISYAYTAYACMYLKTNYSLDWWKAILSNASRDELASKFWRYVSDFTDLPSVNNSSDEFQILGDRLVAPFSIIKGLGEKTYEHIVKNAPYKDFEHFVTVTQSKGENGRAPVTEEMVRKLIVSGLLDELMPNPLQLVEKLDLFEELLAKTKGKKKQAVPEKYIGLGDLGRYLIKKQLVQVYSEDLRPIVLPNRGGELVTAGGYQMWKWKWCDEFNTYIYGRSDQQIDVINGTYFDTFKVLVEGGRFQEGKTIGMIGYIIDEKIKDYANKSKSRNQMSVDVGGLFYEEVVWPKYGETKAESGFKGLVCMLIYHGGYNKKNGQWEVRLKAVTPLITREQIKSLSTI
jgi:DNA-directed DNA polymerase III PolC